MVVLLVPMVGFPGAPVHVLIDRLVFERVPFLVAAPEPARLIAADGVHLTAQRSLDEPLLHDAAALVIFDSPSALLAGDPRAPSLVHSLWEQGRLLGAVGAGVRTLARAGVVRDREIAALGADADEVRRAGGLVLRAPIAIAPPLVTATVAGMRAFADALLEFRGISVPTIT
jgi:DJ-1/PfpI family